jgi:diguanylate cyclase (GGDEF)-like protein
MRALDWSTAMRALDWKTWDFSPRGFARVVVITIVGTLAMLVVALAAVSYTTQFMDAQASTVTYASAIAIPLLVSGPIFYFFASKLRENALMHEQLAWIASQDSLTTCLNRGAFITLVDAYLSQVNAPRDVHGGFLLIDADHFKSINDRFGHAVGDQALQLIVGAVKGTLRSTDLLGRVGGEEFAVLLPQAGWEQAKSIAERIRDNVAGIEFAAEDEAIPLSVSIGGVQFGSPARFSDLHVSADQRLYEAKRTGRNRVSFAALAAHTAPSGPA